MRIKKIHDDEEWACDRLAEPGPCLHSEHGEHDETEWEEITYQFAVAPTWAEGGCFFCRVCSVEF